MIHKMKLNENPFERIKNGTKTIEFRLYDEKRQQIKIGDQIEFSKLPDLQEKLLVDVTELYREDTFENLFRELYTDKYEINRRTKSMEKYYSHEKEKEYGVLGIKIKINVDSLRNNIEKFIPYNEQEEVDKKIMLNYIKDFDDVLTRQNEYGHFTSSAFVLNKDRSKILMAYHRIYNSWAWVGGHSDGDSDLLYVAMKEAKEETGIKKVVPISKDIYSLELINVNGHEKREKYVGSHVHLNVTYLLEADENEEIHIKEDENSGVRWIPINKILESSSEPWVRDRVYAKIIDKILQTKFTDNTAEETQRNMLAQKSKIEKIEQIAAEYYELTQFKRTYFLCEGEETGKSGVLIASNGKVKAMNFKIVLNNDQGHTIKFN